METETIIYILLALVLVYILMSTQEKFTVECGRNDINDQFYRYNVNKINRPVRPY